MTKRYIKPDGTEGPQGHLVDYAERNANKGSEEQAASQTCARCDRAVLMVVNGEPRCSWHVTGKLGGAGLGLARSGEMARKR